MGLTRKERLLKAMLEDNASACGGGVTKEERLLAQMAKKVCENNALEGGGSAGGGAGVIFGRVSEDSMFLDSLNGVSPVTQDMFMDAFRNSIVYFEHDFDENGEPQFCDLVTGYYFYNGDLCPTYGDFSCMIPPEE